MAALDLFLVATAGVDVAALQTTLNSRLPLLPSPSPRLLLWGDFGGARIDFWSEHEPTQLLARCPLDADAEPFQQLLLDLARDFSLKLLTADDVEIEASPASLTVVLEAARERAAQADPDGDEDSGDEDA